MRRTYRNVAIVLIGVAIISYAGYQYHEHQIQSENQERSLQVGIERAQQQYDQLEEQIAESFRDQYVILAKTGADLAGFVPGASSALQQLLKLDQHIDLAKAIGSDDYQNANWNALEEIIGLFGNAIDEAYYGKLPAGKIVTKGVNVIDVAADLFELSTLLTERTQMLALRDQVFQELLRLQGSDPETLAEWQRLYTKLYGDPEAEHQAFLKWLADHHISTQDLMRRVADDLKRNPKVAADVAAGSAIVDPNQDLSLAGVPGINPDFIAAIQRCIAADKEYVRSLGVADSLGPQSDTCAVLNAYGCFGDQAHANAISAVWQARADQLWCNKYPDRSYIPPFGLPSGQTGGPPALSTSTGGSAGAASQPIASSNALAQSEPPAPRPATQRGAPGASETEGGSTQPQSRSSSVRAKGQQVIPTGGKGVPSGSSQLERSAQTTAAVTPSKPENELIANWRGTESEQRTDYMQDGSLISPGYQKQFSSADIHFETWDDGKTYMSAVSRGRLLLNGHESGNRCGQRITRMGAGRYGCDSDYTDDYGVRTEEHIEITVSGSSIHYSATVKTYWRGGATSVTEGQFDGQRP